MLRNSGIEYLKLLAMMLVTAQHSASVINMYQWTLIGDLSWGQFGVSMFMAISGYYSVTGHDPAFPWLVKRLRRLFPAYWLVTILAFILAWATGRPFTVFQVVSQMAGTGFFTHGWNLINVVSWYISLLLLCYGITAASRLSSRPVWVIAGAGVVAMMLLVSHAEAALSRHVITYCVCAVIGRLGVNRLLPAAAGLAVLMFLSSSIIYAVTGMVALWVSLQVRTETSWVLPISDHIYEYFLIHGIFLVGATKVISNPATAVATAIPAAMIGAMLLKMVIQSARSSGCCTNQKG